MSHPWYRTTPSERGGFTPEEAGWFQGKKSAPHERGGGKSAKPEAGQSWQELEAEIDEKYARERREAMEGVNRELELFVSVLPEAPPAQELGERANNLGELVRRLSEVYQTINDLAKTAQLRSLTKEERDLLHILKFEANVIDYKMDEVLDRLPGAEKQPRPSVRENVRLAHDTIQRVLGSTEKTGVGRPRRTRSELRPEA